jgi:hypothetical protein
MKAVKLSASAIADTISVLKADSALEKRWLKCSDTLRSEGVTSELLSSDEEFRKYFKYEVVLLAYSKLEQSIMALPATALSDEQKVTKRYVQAQLGKKLERVAKYVKASEMAETMTDEEKGAKKVSDMATRLKKDLGVWIDKVEKAEAVTFSATEMIKYLKSASALIK